MNAFKQAAAAASAGTGAATGGAVIAASGMSAAGMVGGGAGIGAAAGPVGAVFGAVATVRTVPSASENLSGGNDRVQSSVTYTLPANVENLRAPAPRPAALPALPSW